MQKKYNNKKIHLRKYTLYGIFAFVVLSALIVSLCLTVLFDIREIELIGNKSYDSNLVKSAGDILAGDNIFTVNINSAEKRILNLFSYYKDVKIKRVLPHKIEIVVEEAKITYIAQNKEGKFDIISENGRIMKKNIPYLPEGYISIYGLELENINNGDYIPETDKAKYSLIENLVSNFSKTTSISIIATSNISIVYDDRIQIHFGDDSQMDFKIQMAKSVLQKNDDGIIEGMLDVSNPKEVHFR